MFEVEAQHLLAAAENPHLGNGFVVLGRNELRKNAVDAQALGEKPLAFVAAGDADNDDLRTQARHVHGDVGCASRLLVVTQAAHDGDGRFRRDALNIAPDVFVEHHIADDEDMLGVPLVLDLVNDTVQLCDHCAPLPCRMDAAVLQTACCYHSGVTDFPGSAWSGTLRTIFLDRDGVLNERMPEGRTSHVGGVSAAAGRARGDWHG